MKERPSIDDCIYEAPIQRYPNILNHNNNNKKKNEIFFGFVNFGLIYHQPS